MYCVCGGDPRLRPLLPKTLETPPKNNNNRSTHKFTEPKREGLAACVRVYHCWVYTTCVYIILLLYVYIIILLLLSYDYAVINAVQKTGNKLNKNHIGGGWYNVVKHIYYILYSNNNNKYNGDNNCASELRRRRRDGSAPQDFRASRV